MKSVNNVVYPSIDTFREVISTSLDRPYAVNVAFTLPYYQRGYTRKYIRDLIHKDIDHVNMCSFAPHEKMYFKATVSVNKDIRTGEVTLTCLDKSDELTLELNQRKYRRENKLQIAKLHRKATTELQTTILENIKRNFRTDSELLTEILFGNKPDISKSDTIALPINKEDPNYNLYKVNKFYQQALRQYWSELCKRAGAIGCVDTTNLICYFTFKKSK